MPEDAPMPRTRLQRLMPLALTAVLVTGCATTTSSTGRTQYVGAVSQQQLDQLGAQAFTELRQKKAVSGDASRNAYVACVVDALVRELPPQWQRYTWEEALFVDKEPNAFALPGGKVGVYTGMFQVARTQDQLAAVIGHEIGHVVDNHHNERITRQFGAQAALQVGAMLAGSRYGAGAEQLVGGGGGLLLQTTFLLPGSRVQETEADVVGQRLMAQAGFDPQAAVELWQGMQSATGSEGRPPRFLSTHPDPEGRIRALSDSAPGLREVYEQARRAGKRPGCGGLPDSG